MQRLLVQRLIHTVFVLLAVSILSFMLMRFAPGDPVAAIIGQEMRFVDPQEVARIRANLGLDDPLPVQYFRWLGAALQGDWGYSLVTKQPTLTVIQERIGPTVLLIGTALFISVTLGILLGMISATRHNRAPDYLITLVAFFANAMPQFWVGLMLIYLFAVTLGWLPAGGMRPLGGEDTWAARLRYLILPVMTLSLTNLVVWVRYQRASMLEALHQDYIRSAHAKGLPRRTVLLRHAWRNSLIPIVTLLGNSFGLLVEGAYIVETIFGWPGMGRLGVDSVMRRDYPVVMGVAIISSVVIVLGNLLADITYTLVNPKLRREA